MVRAAVNRRRHPTGDVEVACRKQRVPGITVVGVSQRRARLGFGENRSPDAWAMRERRDRRVGHGTSWANRLAGDGVGRRGSGPLRDK
jgi:hypothetical protein